MLSLLLMAAADPLTGEWRGSSVCQVRPSPCNDEEAVYMIERKGPGYLVHFGKVVKGKQEEFGSAPGTFNAASGQLTVVGHGRGGDFTWHFRVRSGRLTGTLVTPDGVVYRKANLVRITGVVTPLG